MRGAPAAGTAGSVTWLPWHWWPFDLAVIVTGLCMLWVIMLQLAVEIPGVALARDAGTWAWDKCRARAARRRPKGSPHGSTEETYDPA